MKKPDIWPLLAKVVAVIGVTPLTAFVMAKVYSTIWLWFLEPEYTGPSLRAWFGIQVFLSTAIVWIRWGEKDDKVTDAGVAETVLAAILRPLFVGAMMICTAAWIRVCWF